MENLPLLCYTKKKKLADQRIQNMHIKNQLIKQINTRKKHTWSLLIRLCLCVIIIFGISRSFPCFAATPTLSQSYTGNGLGLRILPYYPPYHGIYAHRRHFLCPDDPRSAEEISTFMADYIPPVWSIGEVSDRYVDRCEEMLSLLPENICYLFLDYGWHFYVTAEDIAVTEFDGEYSSVKGVTDVQRLYIKVEDRDNATDTTILHEFGHFLDYCCDFPSEKNEFLKIMEQENDAASEMGMDYGVGDNEEYFAESFLWYLTKPEQMQTSIPRTYAFIHRCLAETIYTVHNK